MSQFDATDRAQMARAVDQVVERPKVGRIVEVFEHLQDDDGSNFEVDVELLNSRAKQHRAIPWQAPQTDEVKVPKVGDKVIVEYRGSSKKSAIARNAVYTNETRPPKARAGAWRKKVESDSSPAGDGNLYIESYTAYGTDQARPEFEKDNATVENSYIRIAKKADDLDETADGDNLPLNIELFDDPSSDAAHITFEANKVDGSDSSNTWGLKLDLKSGEFKLLDGSGYGITSDGAGNFTWNYETIDYSQGSTDSL